MANGKLLVLGATGETGQVLVKRALELGWRVTIYGRRTLPEHAQNADIKSVEGTLDNEEQLRTAIRGQDVIISVVGPSGMRAETAVFVPAYKLILSIMKDEGVKRIIALSTFSVKDPKDKPSLYIWFLTTVLWAIAHKIWKTIVDIGEVFDTYGGDLDWTLFRVGFLGNGPRGRVVDGYVADGKLGASIERADIAEWALTQAEKSPPEHVRQKPGISSLKE
ncbi:NmrA family protein [Annulohypoxylon maeteangense]|uniref:NmrA family protein n=1 Tax=Annulohypoxylon maeteangense TaxID=1927788 RepID=UPI002007E7A2|nr:NmrA family protein [Annulohypoxylon maeteangense]KAI0882020.1 NmrA family protein [Annulohypoxylon maeteangense]